MSEPPKALAIIAAKEALEKQLHNLEGTISRLVRLKDSLPEGNHKDRLAEEISGLDSLADFMQRVLDSIAYHEGSWHEEEISSTSVEAPGVH